MNIAELLESEVERNGEYKALVFEGQEYTNFQQFIQSKCLQTSFSDLGVKKGCNIIVCMMNHPLIYPIFGGIFRTGATIIPVMFTLAAPELRYVAADARAECIITDAANLEKVQEAVKGLDHVKCIIVMGGKADTISSPAVYALETLLENQPKTNLPKISGSDVAMMLYTAGTTGKPKGVMLTHDNLYANGQGVAFGSELENWDMPYISASAMPMAHIFGVGVMMQGITMPKRLLDIGSYAVQLRWFDTEKMMQLIQAHKCTIMAAVPTMLSFILNHPNVDQYDLRSLKEVVCGAAPLPEEVALSFMNKFDCRIREIYGLTENTGLGSANRKSKPYKPKSAGLAYEGTDLAIFDSDDKPLPAYELGEIVLRGPAVMKGYHNRPKETAEALRGGWLHTGDIGYLNEDGYLFVVDRVKDMIIRGGENIYPAEIEDIIYKYPGVAEAAVIGVPDPIYGEKVVAYVVAKEGIELQGQDIIDHVKQYTSSFKAPSMVSFIDGLPKSPIGKILRRDLKHIAIKGD